MGVYLGHPLCLSVLNRVTPLAQASGGLTAGGLPQHHPAGLHRALQSRGHFGVVNSLLMDRKASIHPPELAM